MLREQCKVGMLVAFGRPGGQQTKGTVVKVNPRMAKVQILENRGTGQGGYSGSIWKVSYSMMHPVTGTTVEAPISVFNPANEPLVYSPFRHGDNCIIEAIVDCYHRLEPEHLSGDGERSARQVRALHDSLTSRLGHLFNALGRPVSRQVALAWQNDKLSAN